MTKNSWGAAVAESEAAYPRSGVNLVEEDTYAEPGEALTILGHYEDDARGTAVDKATDRKNELLKENPDAKYHLYRAQAPARKG